eukprot:CAMPEP_0194517030 /NCGR_PEP_ID=MMETSP0253-20130528/50092_1 /TAXON_ID=2966 /ORGANISM="Noctiluca scintillans" /LENGTH=184 /DNA_ID=CAMNT_0039360947 /DNA_START=1 /DNA_END=555 /DNA_ORIENTATION=+
MLCFPSPCRERELVKAIPASPASAGRSVEIITNLDDPYEGILGFLTRSEDELLHAVDGPTLGKPKMPPRVRSSVASCLPNLESADLWCSVDDEIVFEWQDFQGDVTDQLDTVTPLFTDRKKPSYKDTIPRKSPWPVSCSDAELLGFSVMDGVAQAPVDPCTKSHASSVPIKQAPLSFQIPTSSP